MNPIASLRDNRLADRTIALMVLISWFCLMIPPACLVGNASATQVSEAVSANHLDTIHSHKSINQAKLAHDCDSAPCLESQTDTDPALLLTTPFNPDFPIAALVLFWAAYLFDFRFLPKPSFRKPEGHLPGRQVSLIYRFCCLLN